jgi:hypothetical protein
MGRRAAELGGVLVASLFISFVTGLATTGTDEPVLYVVGALVPLGMLLAYWFWIEPRAEADRVTAVRLHQAIDDAFELTQPPMDAWPREAARRAFYDRLDLSDLFEPDHLEAASVLGEAFSVGQTLLHRLDDDPGEPPAALVRELEAWQDRTGRIVETARGPTDATTFRLPTGHVTNDSAERMKVLAYQVQLLELWSGEERRRAGERARTRYAGH